MSESEGETVLHITASCVRPGAFEAWRAAGGKRSRVARRALPFRLPAGASSPPKLAVRESASCSRFRFVIILEVLALRACLSVQGVPSVLCCTVATVSLTWCSGAQATSGSLPLSRAGAVRSCICHAAGVGATHAYSCAAVHSLFL